MDKKQKQSGGYRNIRKNNLAPTKNNKKKNKNKKAYQRRQKKKEKENEIEIQVKVKKEEKEKEKTATNPFEFLGKLKEITPPSLYSMPELSIFINVYLQPNGVPRFITPTPHHTARRAHSGANVASALCMSAYHTDYKPVFGFILFIDADLKFIRANAHVWLEHKKSGVWVDPTPLTDENEESGDQMLVESDALFTKEERETYLCNPDLYNPGAILSHELVPKEYREILCVEHQHVRVQAKELRLEQIKAQKFVHLVQDLVE